MKYYSLLATINSAFFVAFSSYDAIAQDTTVYSLPQVIVQSSRLSLSVFDINQSITVIRPEQLKLAAPVSTEDALRLFTTTEIRRRGAMGVQTDVGIRGSTFSQQLILLNGVRMNDPQTAHHNFDLPVSISSVRQIEIIRGPNSAQYGPDAFGGVINIVTHTTSPALSLELSGGQYGYAGGTGTVGLQSDGIHSTNTIDYKQSDGYHFGTDFTILALSSQNSADVSWGKISFFSGYNKKDFGAFDFYSPGSKNPSHENTETYFASLGTDFSAIDWNFTSRISFRHHFDHFIYTILNPSLSNHQHNTNQYIAELNGTRVLSSSFGISNAAEITHDNINSTKLGIHKRQYAAFSSVLRWLPIERISIDCGARLDIHSDYGATVHPIFNLGFLLTESIKVYSSAGTSFRAPSYTDLYYSDPSTIGNANLKPERGISFELGSHTIINNAFSADLSAFYRKQNNLIDYLQHFNGDLYHAENFSEATVKGFEFQTSWSDILDNTFIIKQLYVGYTFLESTIDKKNAYRTRYSLTHPKHQINGSITTKLPLEIMTTFSGTYRYRIALLSTSTFDLTFTKAIASLDLTVSATNLFNHTYEEIPGIPLPGRWMIAKIRWSLL